MKTLGIIGLIGVMGFVGLTAFAADYIPLAPIPNTVAAGQTSTTLPTYLTGLYKTGIAAAGILAVLMLVWGGFQYATTEAVTGKSESKGIILNVVWGLATVLASYLLLYTINPRLVDIGLALAPLNSVTKTRVPTASESYGKFLDDALEKVKNISTKARDIHEQVVIAQNAVARLQSNLDNGVYEDEEGNPISEADLQKKITDLQTKTDDLQKKEVSVRAYENTNEALSQASIQMQECLKGLGKCSVVGVTTKPPSTSGTTNWILGPIGSLLTRLTYDEKTNGDIVANHAAAKQIVDAARAETNASKKILTDNHLDDQATALEKNMKGIEDALIKWEHDNATALSGQKTSTPNSGNIRGQAGPL